MLGWTKKQTVKESFNMFNLTAQEEVVLAALQETEDWVTVLEKCETIIAENLKTKDIWYVELINIGADLLANCTGDIMKAVEGSTGIPAEWKLSTMEVKISFVLKVLVKQGKFIASIWLKPTAPVEPTV
jgi:hypothetical protein